MRPPLLTSHPDMSRTQQARRHVDGMVGGGLQRGQREAKTAVGFVVERHERVQGVVTYRVTNGEVESVQRHTVRRDGGQRGMGVRKSWHVDQFETRFEAPERGALANGSCTAMRHAASTSWTKAVTGPAKKASTRSSSSRCVDERYLPALLAQNRLQLT